MTRPVELVRQRDGSYALPKLFGAVVVYLLGMAALGVCIGCALAADVPDAVGDTLRKAHEAEAEQQRRALRPHGCRVFTVRVAGGGWRSVMICD